jgi:F-type H+-transporting ATPase subunit gamma
LSPALFSHADTKPSEEGKTIVITSSSDRGLCGGIHSSVAKASRNLLAESGTKSVVLGDKAKAQIARSHKDAIALSFNQIGRAIPTYDEAAVIADTILREKIEFDQAVIIYNYFKSVIAFEPRKITVYSQEAFEKSGE